MAYTLLLLVNERAPTSLFQLSHGIQGRHLDHGMVPGPTGRVANACPAAVLDRAVVAYYPVAVLDRAVGPYHGLLGGHAAAALEAAGTVVRDGLHYRGTEARVGVAQDRTLAQVGLVDRSQEAEGRHRGAPLPLPGNVDHDARDGHLCLRRAHEEH